MSTVLVTGGSGFIGVHAILQLLAAGHQVRTTVRNLKREPDVRAMLKVGGADAASLSNDRLTFFAADLEDDAGWKEAVAGCDYVLHVASPIPPNAPKHEDDLIIPAREGALRVLRASRDAGVKRVVMTSSFAAIGYGHDEQTAPFNETSWSDLTAPAKSPPTQSPRPSPNAPPGTSSPKKAAASSSPSSTRSPSSAPSSAPTTRPRSSSCNSLMDGALPGCPRVSFGVVDVRDVADLHLRAMTNPAAKGERFLAVAGDNMWMLDIAKLLKARMGDAARRVPTRQLPNCCSASPRCAIPRSSSSSPSSASSRSASNEKAKRILGWAPRSNEESVIATAESLVRLGLLKDSSNKGRHKWISARQNHPGQEDLGSAQSATVAYLRWAILGRFEETNWKVGFRFGEPKAVAPGARAEIPKEDGPRSCA